MKITLLALLLGLSLPGIAQQYSETIRQGHQMIYFESFGHGYPVLIINGGPGMNSRGFRSLARQIGQTNRAIIYDQRGTGFSSVPAIDAEHIHIDSMLRDIETLRHHLDIAEWIVFGQSFGGMLAAYYAAEYPDRVHKLILSSSGGIDLRLLSELNITGRLTQAQRDSLTYWDNRILRGDTSYTARLGRGRNLAPAYLYDQSHLPVVAERLTQGNRRINQLVLQSMVAAQFDVREELKDFNRATLVIQGADDIIPVDISAHTHALLPNSRLIVLDHCGHYGWLDQPDRYFSEIGSFLSSKE